MEAFLTEAKNLCSTGPPGKLFELVRSQYGMLKTRASDLEAAAADLDLATQGQLICCLYSICTTAVRNNTLESEDILRTTSSFLLACDPDYLREAGNFTTKLCHNMVTIAGKTGVLRHVLGILRALRTTVEKFRTSPEIMTPIHCEFLRGCLKAEAYHIAVPVLDEPIYDLCGPLVGLSAPAAPARGTNGAQSCGVTPKDFLTYWYYGALIWIGLKEFQKAGNMLLMALVCPSLVLSAIQVDAYKKFVLLGLKLTGEVPEIPKYASQCVHRLSKTAVYELKENTNDSKIDYAAHLRTQTDALRQDGNFGLAKQVIGTLERRKVCALTKTYLTLSLEDIRTRALPDHDIASVESLLVDMIAHKQIDARVDQSESIVHFQDELSVAQDVELSASLEKHLLRVVELSRKVAVHGKDIFDDRDVPMFHEGADYRMDPDAALPDLLSMECQH